MENGSYSINFAGDVMLGRLIDRLLPSHVDAPREAEHVKSFISSNPALKQYGLPSPWGNTLPLFESSDLNIVNLETSVTASNKTWPEKMFNYRMHPDNIKSLHNAWIDYVSLANNHTLDFSEVGLRDTVETLKKASIRFAGVGLGAREATAPADLTMPSETKQHRAVGRRVHSIQIWSAADHPHEWSNMPGFNLIDYSAETKSLLKEAITRGQHRDPSLKIFSVHWGPNYAWKPAREIRAMAHFLIDDCGIDIIHGHSSHHIQGVEKYHGKLIIYGCGDFIDDYALTPEYRNDISAVWRVKVSDKEVSQHLQTRQPFLLGIILKSTAFMPNIFLSRDKSFEKGF
ncbi:MAG: hypothetical protein Q9162_003151 [Coniocarpon cinnabarinum]